MAYYKSLFHKKITNDESEFILDDLALFSSLLFPEEVLPEIEHALKEEMIDPCFLSIKDLKTTLSKGKESVLQELKNNPQYQLVKDVIGDMEKWPCFNEDEYEDEDQVFETEFPIFDEEFQCLRMKILIIPLARSVKQAGKSGAMILAPAAAERNIKNVAAQINGIYVNQCSTLNGSLFFFCRRQ